MSQPNVYETLGVKPLINAAGTFTELGGSLMSADVIAAWQEAAKHFVDLRELQDAVGDRIAKLLGVESVLVTGGAASGIMLGTAAAITLRDKEFLRRSVLAYDGLPHEVIRLSSHRDLYDRQIEMCGVKIVEVETEQDFASAVSDRTAMTMAYNLYEPTSSIDHETWLRLAKNYSLPALLDASADTPPVENLLRFHQLGYDMVVFSGGKAIGGPQNSGLLIGRNDLIDAAKANAVPNEGTIGRVAKVAKEDIVGLWKALEIHLANGDQIADRCQRQLKVIADRLTDLADVQCEFITPPIANHFPHLLIRWDEQSRKLTPKQMAEALRAGPTPIATGRVYGTGDTGLLVSAICLQRGEEVIVADRIHSILLTRHHSAT